MALSQAKPVARLRPPGLIGTLVGARSPLEIHQALWGYIFLLPWLLGLLIFTIGPILVSAYFSLMEYDVLSPPKFIGLENYVRAFTGDKQFWPSLWRTLDYSLQVVPLGIISSLLLAMLLNQGYKGTSFFRTMFFLPSLTPAVALALVWTWLLHPQLGPINFALGWVGIQGPGWLADKLWALRSLVLMALWAGVGGNQMLIFLAGLQGVPRELLEAAEIDGAGPWARFRHVTIPMISPTLLFNLILGIIGALKVFTLAFVATNGGPSFSTWFYALHIYNQAFNYFRMGYASALSWLFLIIISVLTYIQFRVSGSWVFYSAERQ